MDYYFKKAVQVVKKRRRSQEEVAEEGLIEANLHLAAKNCVINVEPDRKDSITSEDLERYNPSFGLSVLEKPPKCLASNEQ
ncbi:hypothetical protein QQS21_006555 [Conoideocrella luteorostrata]|uniref:Uncharacterized protein n=1 Tax=Conoideocrella luteorostrata TaxID=1105319 RepID=A0AAJ0CQB1_9HYPO|nr:hypothetical protein QQS21_006555 [Conoideocrella luteorostrata]